MKILYEDDKKIAVFKPAGMLTQSARSFDTDLVSEVLTYRRSKKEPAYAAVINRLDRPVSGIVLFAKTKQSAGELSQKLQQETFNKQYYAVICGKPKETKGRFVDYLKKDSKNNVSETVSKEITGAKRAELEYEVIKSFDAGEGEKRKTLTLVRIHLITGRHHQIRVQFSSRGMPILGDTKYGAGKEEDCRKVLIESGISIIRKFEIALCAYSITVDDMTYEIPFPWQLK